MTQDTISEKISKEMTIEEILSRFPEKSQKLAKALTNAGLHCVGCGAATWETLEAGMLGHGFQESDIEGLVTILNEILAEKMDKTQVTMTPKAAHKFKEILKEENKEGWHLRLGLKAAGCSGFEYTLDFSEKAKETDSVFFCHGMEVHVSENVLKYLLGAQVDYKDGLTPGFIISNPQAKSTCGCGSSQNF